MSVQTDVIPDSIVGSDRKFAASLVETAQQRVTETDVSIKHAPATDRPCMLSIEDGMLGAFVMREIRNHGYEVVGITHMGNYTNVHIAEQ